jgi:hypothetical protein
MLLTQHGTNGYTVVQTSHELAEQTSSTTFQTFVIFLAKKIVPMHKLLAEDAQLGLF